MSRTSMLSRRPGVELTNDGAFTGRIHRLVWVSLFALGIITALAVRDGAATWIIALMVTGWVLMPALLLLSLGRPKLRYGLLVPGSTFSLAGLGMAIGAETHSVGWLLIAAGLMLGGMAGIWFWMRWLPVPRPFDDPFGWPRLTVIGAHVTLLLTGLATVIAA